MANHPNRNKGTRTLAHSPLPREVVAARECAGDTQTAAALRVYATLRAWQNWESEGTEGRRMHPAVFELYLLKTGQHPHCRLKELDKARPGRCK